MEQGVCSEQVWAASCSSQVLLSSKKARGRRAVHAAHAVLAATCALFILASLVLTAAAVILFVDLPHELANPSIAFLGAESWLAAPGTVWLLASSKRATWHLRLAVIYALLNWALRLVLWLNEVWLTKRPLGKWWQGLTAQEPYSDPQWDEVDQRYLAVEHAIFAGIPAVWAAMLVVGAWMAILRVRALERACLVGLHSKQLTRIVWLVCLLTAVLAALFCFARSWLAVHVAGIGALACLAVAGVLVFMHGIWRALKLAREARANAPEGRAAQTRNVHSALRREFACILLMFLTSGSVVVLWVLRYLNAGPSLDNLRYVIEVADTVCNEWFALSLSGALDGAMRGTTERAAAAKARKRRWADAEAEWSRRQRDSKSEEWAQWDEKVCELAGRGISLDALLRFYGELPSLMEAYDPCRHTTNDVVRGAIIPFSAEQQAACATVLMGGAFTLPDKMVTHNWSNLFMDLVAAILADALGESEFSMISSLLVSDLPRLAKWVNHGNVGSRTYWVCAFAVNQHVGICGSVRSTAKDTVTGVRPKECLCGLKKAWNNTEPLLPDGRSIPCEMNKFDDMMKCLAATNPGFEQVLAIDEKFTLFSRAWCVAEVATASWSGMVQRLKIHSQEAMGKCVEQLHGLRIQEMQASRPEDKEAILKSISDLEAFNENLQRLLFTDLIPAWTSLDAEERMASAGSVIRWLPVWAGLEELPAASNVLI